MVQPILVFDVNETLLDITPLEPHFEEWFGDAGAMRKWFAQLVLYSQSITLAGRYLPFGIIASHVLEMLATIEGCALPEGAARVLKHTMTTLPAHADALEGLEHLHESGFRLATLTNSDPETQAAQLSNAGIACFFEKQFSVEAVEQFKPAAATYRHVATEMRAEVSGLAMIACHSWDLLGAAAAGLQPVFIKRAGNSQPGFASQGTREIARISDLASLNW
ncbi:haloacid dehalogenase type II [Blastomonas sp.]|uniref:haloacid dehalogenase type II n=1 Tax=Blastomonas sp. TaxID=1909299 RepID=UPI003594391D